MCIDQIPPEANAKERNTTTDQAPLSPVTTSCAEPDEVPAEGALSAFRDARTPILNYLLHNERRLQLLQNAQIADTAENSNNNPSEASSLVIETEEETDFDIIPTDICEFEEETDFDIIPTDICEFEEENNSVQSYTIDFKNNKILNSLKEDCSNSIEENFTIVPASRNKSKWTSSSPSKSYEDSDSTETDTESVLVRNSFGNQQTKQTKRPSRIDPYCDNCIEVLTECDIIKQILREHIEALNLEDQISKKSYQMGIDIYAKLQKLLQLNLRPNTQTQEFKRKRGAEAEKTNVNYPQLIKYRRVENRFPKFVQSSSEDELNSAFPSYYEQLKYLQSPPHTNRNMDITNRKTMQATDEKRKQRKSVFAAPKPMHKLVKNSTYTNMEFSDDEFDDELQILNDIKNASHDRPIEKSVMFTLNKHAPPPPLICAKSGKFLQSTMFTDHRMKTSRNYGEQGRQNGLSTISNGSMTNLNMSITEKGARDRDEYQHLLQRMIPRIYGAANNAPKLHKIDQRREGTLLNETGLSVSSFHARNMLSNPQSTFKESSILSTICLDDEPHIKVKNSQSSNNSEAGIIVDDSDDVFEIDDSDDNKPQKLVKHPNDKNQKVSSLPSVARVNSFQDQIKDLPHIKGNWLQLCQSKWTSKRQEQLEELKEAEERLEKHTKNRRAAEMDLHEHFRTFTIYDTQPFVFDEPEDSDLVVEKTEPEFIELTTQQKEQIKAAISGPPEQVLVSKFNLHIRRRDIHTLLGHNWLNDEVINFYMSLLTERGEKKNESHGLPLVYAMNTFFIPKLTQNGHSGVRRWTRKVDIFAKDIIPVPVHVGGVHWCMAIIHLKNRTILYYDSMGTPNPSVLKTLESYLKEESMDKRKQPFDTTKFEIESVRDVPRQFNGSDCGVFSCMFAEYITRNKPITFTQENMAYFRQKMILEIVQGELLR